MPGPIFYPFVLVTVTTLATAAYFALRPSERTLGVIRPLAAATIFSALAAFFAGVTNGLFGLGRALQAGQTPTAGTMITAFAESPIPLVGGFAAVAATWVLVAVGLRRQA